MKKVILMLLTLLFLNVAQAQENDSQILQDKLAKLKVINANFSQVVRNAQGDILNKSIGTLTVSRPGKFIWHVTSPDEQMIVSNGTTMWIYDPFIEQVTLLNFNDTITDTPFVLLTGNAKKQWKHYKVSQKNNQFTLISTRELDSKGRFIFEFSDQGDMSKFIIIDEQGQRSEFTLTSFALRAPLNDKMFEFIIPDNVEVDDQR
ncbi:outer membrane lipoprotein chaperone LolA [Psychromonas sp. CD1]|uniref:outer membrane lipoprotein chaperone LolA n=1 Tax=Psychromonas sp. CD1 TaxID=1979839 RepID=UPI000B9AA436|nr:outer membrane lipoprotein chaperone LolA [Psychromonas sp. CD1]